MKTELITALSAIALLGFLSATTVYAEEGTAPAAQSHEGHHPDAKTAPKEGDQMNMDHMAGMMKGMDMSQMQGMMHECMEKHKDGKMCNHDMMDKCQKNMGKGDCQKMMKQMKTEKEKK